MLANGKLQSIVAVGAGTGKGATGTIANAYVRKWQQADVVSHQAGDDTGGIGSERGVQDRVELKARLTKERGV